jgi:energy-coupling factor transporter ATP-binding protein EcfA2
MQTLGIRVQSIRQAIETLSGGQRQAVAVARAAAWGRKVVILDEPTASLGVRETHQVLDLIRLVRERGLSVVLISHSMPEVFAIADRIHIHRLGRRAAIVSPKTTGRLAAGRGGVGVGGIACITQPVALIFGPRDFSPVGVANTKASQPLEPRKPCRQPLAGRWRRTAKSGCRIDLTRSSFRERFRSAAQRFS